MNENIIEKIRALLRLARSDNAHEAALAMQRAMEIATKHQIDLAGLSPDDDIHKLLGRYMATPARLALEWKEALNIAHGFFNVSVTTIIRGSKCLIVGTALDIELAEYVITYLVRACRQCLARWKEAEAKARRKTSGPKIAAFIDGFFFAIRVKLRKQQQAAAAENAGLALVIDKGHQARKAFTTDFFGDGKKLTTLAMPEIRKDRRALVAGFASGQSTELNPALRGNSSTLALA